MDSTRSLLITCPQGLWRFPPAGDRRRARPHGESPALAGPFLCPAHAKRMGPAAETRDYGVDRLILASPCPSRRPISSGVHPANPLIILSVCVVNAFRVTTVFVEV